MVIKTSIKEPTKCIDCVGYLVWEFLTDQWHDQGSLPNFGCEVKATHSDRCDLILLIASNTFQKTGMDYGFGGTKTQNTCFKILNHSYLSFHMFR